MTAPSIMKKMNHNSQSLCLPLLSLKNDTDGVPILPIDPTQPDAFTASPLRALLLDNIEADGDIDSIDSRSAEFMGPGP